MSAHYSELVSTTLETLALEQGWGGKVFQVGRGESVPLNRMFDRTRIASPTVERWELVFDHNSETVYDEAAVNGALRLFPSDRGDLISAYLQEKGGRVTLGVNINRLSVTTGIGRDSDESACFKVDFAGFTEDDSREGLVVALSSAAQTIAAWLY